MKILLKIFPIIYALLVVLLSYQSSSIVGGLLEEPAMSEMVLSAVKLLCFISTYVLYFFSLRGRLSFKYCYIVLFLHLGLALI